ncbi:MAG: hypothetical protein ABEJ64_03080 [Candidatus Nanohaloarchaea archaeon]
MHVLDGEGIDPGQVFDDLEQMERQSSCVAEIGISDGPVDEVEYDGEGFRAVMGRRAVEVVEQDLIRMNRLDDTAAKYMGSLSSEVYTE